MKIFLVLIALTLVGCSGKKMFVMDYCGTAGDCAPAACCHPDSLVNKNYVLDCSDIVCTMVCQGPLDCNAGHVECINNKCKIIPN